MKKLVEFFDPPAPRDGSTFYGLWGGVLLLACWEAGLGAWTFLYSAGDSTNKEPIVWTASPIRVKEIEE